MNRKSLNKCGRNSIMPTQATQSIKETMRTMEDDSNMRHTMLNEFRKQYQSVNAFRAEILNKLTAQLRRRQIEYEKRKQLDIRLHTELEKCRAEKEKLDLNTATQRNKLDELTIEKQVAQQKLRQLEAKKNNLNKVIAIATNANLESELEKIEKLKRHYEDRFGVYLQIDNDDGTLVVELKVANQLVAAGRLEGNCRWIVTHNCSETSPHYQTWLILCSSLTTLPVRLGDIAEC